MHAEIYREGAGVQGCGVRPTPRPRTPARPRQEFSGTTVLQTLAVPAQGPVPSNGLPYQQYVLTHQVRATRGGALRLEEASLHVVLAATHVYDKGLVDTVVEDSVNPIDGVERSTLIMASAVLQRPAAALIRAEHVARARELTPQLFVTRS